MARDDVEIVIEVGIDGPRWLLINFLFEKVARNDFETSIDYQR